ncbi:MAG: hypothetical protein ACUVTM_01980 [Candidatus Bathyarchaeia archaeon]
MARLDNSSFADKILAASSLAFESSNAEVEFAFTERLLENPELKNRISEYATQHSKDGFTFDSYLYICSRYSDRLSKRSSRLLSRKPMEDSVRDFMAYISTMGRLEDLIEYCLVRMELRLSDLVQAGDSMDQTLKVMLLIENDNSYEVNIDCYEGSMKFKESNLKYVFDGLFQSRLKLVRSFTR